MTSDHVDPPATLPTDALSDLIRRSEALAERAGVPLSTVSYWLFTDTDRLRVLRDGLSRPGAPDVGVKRLARALAVLSAREAALAAGGDSLVT